MLTSPMSIMTSKYNQYATVVLPESTNFHPISLTFFYHYALLWVPLLTSFPRSISFLPFLLTHSLHPHPTSFIFLTTPLLPLIFQSNTYFLLKTEVTEVVPSLLVLLHPLAETCSISLTAKILWPWWVHRVHHCCCFSSKCDIEKNVLPSQWFHPLLSSEIFPQALWFHYYLAECFCFCA